MTSNFDPVRSPVYTLPPLTLINASAGTGKTWAITHLCARWLVEVEGRHPNQVLLVTFGNEAASELKARTRAQLESMREALGGSEVGSEFAPFIERATQVGSAIILQRIEGALRSLDDLNARTIHSFSALLHRDGQSIDASSKVRLKRAIRETLFKFSQGADSRVTRIEELLVKYSGSTSPIKILQKSLEKTLSTATSAGGLQREGTLFHFSTSTPMPMLEELGKMEKRRLSDEEIAAIMAEREAERQKDMLAYRALFEEFALEVERREIELRALDGVVSYDALIGDLAIRARCDAQSVRRELAGQFRLVMIDEFQDTDVAQWEIFRTLFQSGDEPSPMVLVGDAKQAIYGFRGGDVRIIQRVGAEVRSNPLYAASDLRINFRSHQRLIDGLNQFYQPTLHGETLCHQFAPGSSTSEPIMYVPVDSGKGPAGVGAFTIRDITKLAALAPASISALHRDVVQQVVTLTRDAGNASGALWQYRDIAILCRTNKEIDTLQQILQGIGIPCVTPKTRTVFRSKAASHFRSLLWALADPGDIRRVRFLAATWFEPLLDASFDFGEGSEKLRTVSVGALQRLILSGGVQTRVLQARGGLRHLTDIEHCFDVLAEAFPKGVSPVEALDWFDGRIADDKDEDSQIEIGKRRIDSDESAVRLLTIVSAKGLEFPVVLVPELQDTKHDPVVFSFTSEFGRHVDPAMAMFKEGQRTGFYEVIQESRQEFDRLTYVALTRAKQVLIVWHTTAWEGDPSKASTFSELVELYRASAHEDPLVEIINVEDDDVPDELPELQTERVSLVPTPTEPSPALNEAYRRWSYSRLAVRRVAGISLDSDFEGGSAAEVDDHEQSLDGSLPGFKVFGEERGARLGDAVHGCLEVVVGKVSANDHDALRDIAEQKFAEQGVRLPTDIVETLQRILVADLGPAFGNESLESYVRNSVVVGAEMRFTLGLVVDSAVGGDGIAAIKEVMARHDASGPFGNFFNSLVVQPHSLRMTQGYLNGSIDLVAPVIGTNQFRIVDYKTNCLKFGPTFAPEYLIAEMEQAGYPLQALLYAVALFRHLRWRSGGSMGAENIAGASYLYVRGMAEATQPGYGVIDWRIPPTLIEEISQTLEGLRSSV